MPNVRLSISMLPAARQAFLFRRSPALMQRYCHFVISEFKKNTEARMPIMLRPTFFSPKLRKKRIMRPARLPQLSRPLIDVPLNQMSRQDTKSGALRFENLISDASSRFAASWSDQIDHHIGVSLRKILNATECDQCGLFTINPETGRPYFSHLQYLDVVVPEQTIGDLAAACPWIYEILVKRAEPFSFRRLADIPEAAYADRRFLQDAGIRASVWIPFSVDSNVRHIFVLFSRNEQPGWTDGFVENLTTLGGIFVSALSRKNVFMALRRKALSLAKTQTIGNCYSWEWDIASGRLRTSEGTDGIWGGTVKSIKDFVKLIHPDDRGTIQKKIKKSLSSPRDKYHFEYRICGPDGKERPVEHQYEFVCSDNGTPMQAFGAVLDVTTQMEAKHRLHEAEQFYQSTLNALYKFVCVIDAEGTVVRLSDNGRATEKQNDLFPIPIATGDNYFMALEAAADNEDESIATHAHKIRTLLYDGVDEIETEFSLCVKTDQRWFGSKANRFIVDDVSYVVISHEDITEQKRREHEIEGLRAQQWHNDRITRTGLLIASVAHELNQPLAAILNNAQAGLRFISSNKTGYEEIKEIFMDIVSDEKRAGKIIDSLRNMLRRQSPICELFDAKEVLLDVLAILHSEFIRQSVKVEISCDEKCFVLADKSQIQQVVLNLLLNAIDAMKSPSITDRRLAIALRRTGDGHVMVSVRDSGVGIFHEDFDKVFDAFWTTKHSGMGMGLAICRSIIESHHGKIWVESGDDQGAIFCFTLREAKSVTHGSEEAGESEECNF